VVGRGIHSSVCNPHHNHSAPSVPQLINDIPHHPLLKSSEFANGRPPKFSTTPTWGSLRSHLNTWNFPLELRGAPRERPRYKHGQSMFQRGQDNLLHRIQRQSSRHIIPETLLPSRVPQSTSTNPSSHPPVRCGCKFVTRQHFRNQTHRKPFH